MPPIVILFLDDVTSHQNGYEVMLNTVVCKLYEIIVFTLNMEKNQL